MKIGIVTPASGDDIETINNFVSKFKKLGFTIKEGKYLKEKNLYLSGTDKERASDLNDMFADKEIDAIICFRGGYGCIRMLPYLNLKIIKENPKPLFGYSDITLLINYLSQINIPTYHAPMIKSDFSDLETLKYLNLALLQKDYIIDLKNYNSIETFNSQIINGQIVGGNLSIVCSSLSTPYEVKFKDNILLLEEINEEPYAIDRMLQQLIHSKKLDFVKAFLIGHFTPFNLNTMNLIKNLLVPLKKPIMFGVPIGHDYPNITLPLNTSVKIDYYQKKIFIKQKNSSKN